MTQLRNHGIFKRQRNFAADAERGDAIGGISVLKYMYVFYD